MATLEELEKQKPVIDKVSEFISKRSRLIMITFGLISIFEGIIVWNGFNLQECIFCIAIIFFLINLYLLWLSSKGKNIPAFIGVSRWATTIILVSISVSTFIADKEHHVILPITIVILSLVNHGISGVYKDKWNMPDILFKKLITIETLGLIIAGLQLVIAYPQLKLAYKSVSSDEITSFRENIRQFNTHVESFVFVDIPDSLMNENVKIARRFQKQIYTYSLFIVNANWDRDISIHTFDIDSVMQTPQFRNDKTYDQLRIKKNQEFLNNYIFNMLAPQKITNVTERIQANNKGTQRLSETLNQIHEYYSNSADSTLLISQIELKIMENTLSSQGELNTSLGQSLSKLETTYENIKRIRENKGLDIYNKEKKVKEEFIGFQSVYNQYLLNPAFNVYIKGMDEMCVDYIAFLNLIQLKYAYNVDLDLSRD